MSRILIIIILCFGGCAFKNTNTSRYILGESDFYKRIRWGVKHNKNYFKDSLYVNDFVIQSKHSNSTFSKWEVLEIDADSVKNLFDSSLTQTKLNIYFNTNGENRVNEQFLDNTYMKPRKVNRDTILFYSKDNSKDYTVLFPIISYTSYYSNNTAFGFSGVVPGEWKFHSFLTLTIYLVKNEEIIYVGQVYSPYVHEVENKLSIDRKKVPIERWDELVYEVLNEYINRLK